MTQTTPELRRSVGFWGLLAFSVGINIGAGLFILLNVAAGLTGAYLPIAMIIAALPAFIALVPYTTLASAYPTTAASYRYVQLLRPNLGVGLVIAIIAAVLIGGQPLFALVAGAYLAEIFPVSPLVVAVVALTLFYVVNLLGIRPTAALQIILVAGLVAAIAAYALLGLGHLDAAHFTPEAPAGLVGVLAGGGLLFALMAGGLFIVDVGDEVVDPRRLYRQVLPLGMIIVFGMYWLVVVVTVGVVPWSALEDRTLIAAAEVFMGDAMIAFFVLAGALVATVTTLNVTFTLVSRSMLAIADDGVFPAALGRVNRRFGTPHGALTAAYLVSLVVVFLNPSAQYMGTVLNIGLVAAIGLVSLAGARLPVRHPEILEAAGGHISLRTLKLASYTVVVMNSLIVVLLVVSMPSAAISLLALGVAGVVYARVAGVDVPERPFEPRP